MANGGIIVLLTLLSFLTLGMIFLIIWEIKKRNDFSVIAHFITDDKSELKKRFKNITREFSFKDETYFYDDKCSYTRGKNKHIFYLKGYSAPIDFTLSNDQLHLKYDSKTIDRLLKNNIIQKMLDDIEGHNKSQEQRLVLYLILLGIAIVFAINYVINNHDFTCTLIGNNQTIQVIADGVLKGIK